MAPRLSRARRLKKTICKRKRLPVILQGCWMQGLCFVELHGISNDPYIKDCLAQSTTEISHEAMDHEMDLSSMLWALNKLKAPRAP